MAWKREDTIYAAAALAAATVVAYFVIANFGLVPSPLAPTRPGSGAIAVPDLGPRASATSGTPRARQSAVAVARVPTPVRLPPAASPTRPAADRTPPTARFTTAGGTQFSLTSPSTVDGTASDAAAGVGSVNVTFTRGTGGGTTTAAARVACSDASRRSCTWSADVPDVAGQYDVTVRSTDRAGNPSAPASISITVVNGGDVVSTVTSLLGGLVGSL